jgi:hypothetical protein
LDDSFRNAKIQVPVKEETKSQSVKIERKKKEEKDPYAK